MPSLTKKNYFILYGSYIGAAGILYVLSLVIQNNTLRFISLFFAGAPILYKAYKKLHRKFISTEFFLVIASGVALLGHQERAMNIVLIIMIIAEYLEDMVYERAQSAIKALLNLVPQTVIVQNGTEEIKLPLSQVFPGTLVIVPTGNNIPVDGLIVSGAAQVNEASLTGESLLKQKERGNRVYAGTFVQSGSIVIKTAHVGKDTFFGRITALVHQAEEAKAKVTVTADKIATLFVPLLLTAIGITWLITKNSTLVTTLLVFGSPFELTLITPLAILSAIMAGFRNGILIKGGRSLEMMGQIDTLIFDKTGTLTLGDPEIVKIQTITKDYTEDDLLFIAAIAQKRADHAASKALLKMTQRKGMTIPDAQQYISVSGHGVEIIYNNQKWFVGNEHFIQAPEHANSYIAPEYKVESTEYMTFFIASNDIAHGKFFMADVIRPEAKSTINDLKKLIKNVLLISGDRQKIADMIAQKLNIDTAYGGIMPDEKLLKIKNMQQNNHIVAMVGDGINDAPALKQADVGIALGAMGMEPAIEAAEIVLMTNDLRNIVFLVQLSKKMIAIVYQNLVVGFLVVHGLGILFAFFGYITPLKAAFFHGISDLLILLNSLRLMQFKKQP